MSVAFEFEKALEYGLLSLAEDEWAIAKAEDAILAQLEPHEAFMGIAGVVKLATKQTDDFCFATCCWFILKLARKAETTEFPPEAMSLLNDFELRATALGEQSQDEFLKVLNWFRLPSNKSLKSLTPFAGTGKAGPLA